MVYVVNLHVRLLKKTMLITNEIPGFEDKLSDVAKLVSGTGKKLCW